MNAISPPLAPWALAGESIVALARWRGVPPVFPVGLSALPGPSMVAATRYTDSPVGPYVELIVGHPARLGLRVGWMVSEAVVTEEDARIGGRLNWGFPSERADLRWEVDGRERALVWSSRGFAMRGTPRGMPLPWLVPVRGAAASQRRLHDRPRPSARPSPVRAGRRRGEARRRARCSLGATPRCDGVGSAGHGAPCPRSARLAEVARRPAEGSGACGMV